MESIRSANGMASVAQRRDGINPQGCISVGLIPYIALQ